MAITKEDIIAAIKEMPLMEVAELVKMMEEEFGVSATPVAVAGAAAAVAVEEQTEFDVILKDVGSEKIKVIKEVRAITSLGLKEAKELVESAPKEVVRELPKEEAEKIKKQLEAVGAVAEVK
jgi:large subunit ribosomal protein L7/L12